MLKFKIGDRVRVISNDVPCLEGKEGEIVLISNGIYGVDHKDICAYTHKLGGFFKKSTGRWYEECKLELISQIDEYTIKDYMSKEITSQTGCTELIANRLSHHLLEQFKQDLPAFNSAINDEMIKWRDEYERIINRLKGVKSVIDELIGDTL